MSECFAIVVTFSLVFFLHLPSCSTDEFSTIALATIAAIRKKHHKPLQKRFEKKIVAILIKYSTELQVLLTKWSASLLYGSIAWRGHPPQRNLGGIMVVFFSTAIIINNSYNLFTFLPAIGTFHYSNSQPDKKEYFSSRMKILEQFCNLYDKLFVFSHSSAFFWVFGIFSCRPNSFSRQKNELVPVYSASNCDVRAKHEIHY